MAKINHTIKYIEIETCSACTRCCNWCLYGHYNNFRERGNEILEIRYIEQVFKELAENGYKGIITLCSMNEPLLDERITDGTLLKLGRFILGDEIPFLLISNGDLLTEKILEILFVSGLSRLIISCYDKQSLEECYHFTQYGFNVEISDKRYFQNGGWEYNRAGSIDCFSNKNLNYSTCYLPMFQSVIGWDGEVRLCCYDALGKVKLGNIKEVPYFDILTNKTFYELRSNIRTNRQTIAPCNICNYRGELQDILAPFTAK